MTYYRPTVVDISYGALRNNLRKAAAVIKPAKLLFVVKANAYGHGAEKLAAMAEHEKLADFFAVSSIEEGLQLRNAGINLPVLILGSLYPFESFIAAIKANITVTIASMEAADYLLQAVDFLKMPAFCHIKLETGMGRIGMRRSGLPDVIKKLSGSPLIRISGLYTHFSCADCDGEYTAGQAERLKKAYDDVKDFVLKRAAGQGVEFICHASASEAALRYPQYHFDMCRIGKAAYGMRDGYQPVLSWKSRIVFMKDVGPGASISYNRSFRVTEPMRVATVPVGYADGYSRLFSNKADVLVGGSRCRVLGNVTMDMMMVDVSGVPSAEVGSEVVLVGRQKGEEITLQELADISGTINYETAVDISSRVPRIFTDD